MLHRIHAAAELLPHSIAASGCEPTEGGATRDGASAARVAAAPRTVQASPTGISGEWVIYGLDAPASPLLERVGAPLAALGPL